MTKKDYPGYWYCEAIPTGQHVKSAFPDGLLFVRISPDGAKWAGCGHDGLVYENGKPEGRAFEAPRAVIYDQANQLHVVEKATWPGTGSQGWRYANESGLVPAWSTYADPDRQIWEYTVRGDITIGQGPTGVVAILPNKRVRLDHLFPNVAGGEYLYVNFSKSGQDCAVSWYVAHSPTSYTACLLWLKEEELRKLPSYVEPVSPPVVPPVKEPVKVPESIQSTVDKYIQKYGLSEETKPAIINATAWEHRSAGWGLSAKPGGHNGTQPGTGLKVATDILHHKPSDTLWDALTDTGSMWSQAAPHNDPSRPWVAPVEPQDGSGTPIPPVPDPQPWKDEIKRLEGILSDLKGSLFTVRNRMDVAEEDLKLAISRLDGLDAQAREVDAAIVELAKPLKVEKRWGFVRRILKGDQDVEEIR